MSATSKRVQPNAAQPNTIRCRPKTVHEITITDEAGRTVTMRAQVDDGGVRVFNANGDVISALAWTQILFRGARQ